MLKAFFPTNFKPLDLRLPLCLAILLSLVACARPSEPEPFPLTEAETLPATTTGVLEPTNTAPAPPATASPLPSLTSSPTLVPTPTPSVAPTSTSTSTPTKTVAPTRTAHPSPTPTIPTETPFPTPTPLWGFLTPNAEQAAWLNAATLPQIGTPFPQPEATISVSNANQLTEQARWGKGAIREAVYAPNGDRLYGLTDLGLTVFDAASANEIASLPLFQTATALALAPDGEKLALALETEPPTVAIYDVSTLRPTDLFPFEGELGRDPEIKLYFSGDGQRLVATVDIQNRWTGWVNVWRIENNSMVAQTTDADDPAGFPLASHHLYAPGTDQFLFSLDDTLEVWGRADEDGGYQFERVVELPRNLAEDLSSGQLLPSVSPDGRWLSLTDTHFFMTHVVNLENDKLVLQFESWPEEEATARRSQAQAAGYAGQPIVSASYDVASLSGPGLYYVNQTLFSPNGRYLAIVRANLGIEVWDIESGALNLNLDGAGNRVLFDPQSETIATLYKRLSQWTLSDGTFKNVTRQHFGSIRDLQFVPNTDQIALADSSGFLYLRDIQSGRSLGSMRGYIRSDHAVTLPGIEAIEVSNDGRFIIAAGSDALKRWDLTTAGVTDLVQNHYGVISPRQITLSGDNRFINIASPYYQYFLFALNPDSDVVEDDDCISENDATYDDSIFVIGCGQSAGCNGGLLFDASPVDPFLLACADEAGQIALWESETRKVQTLAQFDKVSQLKFSADGSTLIAVSFLDNTLWLSVWGRGVDKFELIHETALDYLAPFDTTFLAAKISVSPDNSLIALTIPNRETQIISAQNGENVATLPLQFEPNVSEFSTDGRLLVVGTRSGTVHLFGIP